MPPDNWHSSNTIFDGSEPSWNTMSRRRATSSDMQAKLDTFDTGFDQARHGTKSTAIPLLARPAGSLGLATDPRALLSGNNSVAQGAYTNQPEPVTPSSYLSAATSSWGGSQVERSPSRTPATTSYTPSRSSAPLRFACPFFKKDRARYNKACAGRGWSDIRRLKEHLYRHHSQAHHCARCQTRFESSAQVWQHLRQPDPCTFQSNESIEGMTPPQEKELKSRKRNRFETDIAEWNHIYMSLFPGELPRNIPMPYRDDDYRPGHLDEDGNQDQLPWDFPPGITIDPPEVDSSRFISVQDEVNPASLQNPQLFDNFEDYIHYLE